jgi:hypothetical protein
MGETSGAVAADSSGNNNAGEYHSNVLFGHPALLASEPISTSVSMVNGHLATNAKWAKRAVTAECWIKPSESDVAWHPRIFSNGWTDHSGKGFMLWMNGGKASFQAGYDLVSDTTNLTVGSTYHLVGTFDIATGTTLYVNGVAVGNRTPGTGPVPTPQNGDYDGELYVGVLRTSSGFSDNFDGDISNCALYDHALSADQIAAHYHAGMGPNSTPVPVPSSTATSIGIVPPNPVPTATAAPSASPVATPTPAVSPSSAPSTMTYDATKACINHGLYTNSVLPSGVGEFATNGLDRNYWGGTKTRTVGQYAGSWGPGFQTSWGRHQYDTYFSDSSDGLGIDPFYVGPDTAAPGSPQALRISAMPLPSNVKNSLTVMGNDQWQVTSASAPFVVPSEGGSLTVKVANPGSAQNGWSVGMGYKGGAITFVGKLTSGGNVTQTNAGASNPWTISNVHIYSGAPGTIVTPGGNDEGGFRAYQFPDYVSGVLDANINQEYGFFVSRIRLPEYVPAVSPAFWTLETGGVANPSTGLQRNELDIMEMFGNTSGNALNQNEILWNKNPVAGVGVVNFPSGTPQANYHDYGTLVTPTGTSFYIDGHPTPGDVNLPNWTQGSPDKELMLMFQVGAPGSWLDGNSKGMSNAWPLYMWSQWIRAYAPTSSSC